MRANRERGEHGAENASSCSGPNGEAFVARIDDSRGALAENRAALVRTRDAQLVAASGAREWIPVTDSEPPKDGTYLICTELDEFVALWYRGEWWCRGMRIEGVTHYCEKPARPDAD